MRLHINNIEIFPTNYFKIKLQSTHIERVKLFTLARGAFSPLIGRSSEDSFQMS